MGRGIKTLLVGVALSAAVAASPARAQILDGSFEDPAVPSASFTLFSTGQTFGTGNPWSVVGATGNVGIVSGAFTQNDGGVLFVFSCPERQPVA